MAGTNFKANFLAKHNEYRKKHGAPALTFNEDLCTSSQAWANNLLSTKNFEHSNTNNGENLYLMGSSGEIVLTGEEPVINWYNEIKDYDYSKPGFNKCTGHFTQLVWKSTSEVGVGIATDGKTVYVVSQYKPAGNINSSDHFQSNVLPAGQ